GARLARLEDGAGQLLAVERLAAVVALHHVREHVLDVLVGGVPAVALETFAPAADELAVPAHPGGHHAILGVAAEGAFHGRSRSRERGDRDVSACPPVRTPPSVAAAPPLPPPRALNPPIPPP